LAVVVNVIDVSLVHFKELLEGFQVPFSAGVKDGSLVVDVKVVDLTAIFNQKVNQLILSFTGCIVQRSLFQAILLTRIDIVFLKNLGHSDSLSIVGNKSDRKHWTLLECSFILESADINSSGLDLVNHSFDVPLFHKFKETLDEILHLH